MIYIIIAFIAGALVILSMVINSRLSDKIGVFPGTLVNYIVGLIGITIFLLIKDGGISISLKQLQNIPLWAYLGGVIGVTVVSASNVVIPKIPTIYSTLLNFIGQITTGMVVDFISVNTISMGKIFGSILILLGLLYNLYVDRRELKNSLLDN